MSILFDAEPGKSYLIEVSPRLEHFGLPTYSISTVNEDSGSFIMNIIKQEK